MDTKILNIFKESGGCISGEELSKKLGISRAAVWKQIEKLRSEGYEITAQPHLGYMLVRPPDKLLPEEVSWQLNTRIMGRKIYSYVKTSSTMDIARTLAQSGAGEGTSIFAEEQTSGRGRLGREWISPSSCGIYLSIILKPDILPEASPTITLMGAVSIAQAIRAYAPIEAVIKWPNDILVNGDKVCGILTEMEAEADAVHFIILGVGINVNTAREDLPRGASSLMLESGKALSRIDLTKEILRRLDENYTDFKKHGFKPVIGKWKDFSATLGSRVMVKSHHEKIEGQAVDLSSKGALIVRLDSGLQQEIHAGDVTILR